MSIERLQWSVATAVMPGEIEAGDRHVVCPLYDGVLVAVIDGLGHGVEAAAAARMAAGVLEKHAGDRLRRSSGVNPAPRQEFTRL
jgi:negative regulator of sigma-B (phosphoserine phosphatase)